MGNELPNRAEHSTVQEQPVTTEQLFSALPPEWPKDLRLEIQQRVDASSRKLVVIDDDPLGTQTVYDVPVFSGWSIDTLGEALARDCPAFYVLTNSRGMNREEAVWVNMEVGRNLREAAVRTGREFEIVSRSDSTLRGHFPSEVEALASGLRQEFDACILIPFFLEGGRFTVDDIHYVADGDLMLPAAKTEFARDHTFGYRESNLRRWVEEKTDGRVSQSSVASISIQDIRVGGPSRVTEVLISLPLGAFCVVNAVSMRDLHVFVRGLLDAEVRGKRFMFRTAASFVKARLGMEDRPLLTSQDVLSERTGSGLVVVGSYVARTTAQLEYLLSHATVDCVEIDVQALLDDRRDSEIRRVSRQVSGMLGAGRDVIVYTSRGVHAGRSAAHSLDIGKRVSGGLVSIIRTVRGKLRYVVAKGGVTASEIATRAFDARSALVLGQILPGVPVWRLGPDSRYPDLPYIVFPGNVGGTESLAEVVARLAGS